MRGLQFLAIALGAGALLASCSAPLDQSKTSQFRPISPDFADLWDRQTTENADILGAIVDEFNQSHPAVPVKVVQSGNYGDIYQKTTAAIKARALPAMAVAYGNMTVEYANEGAVVTLDAFIHDEEAGLSDDELADFFPSVLDQNRYPAFDNAMLSFPYTKAVLVMYFNTDVLGAAGITAPPSTWDEFLDACRQVKSKTGKYGISLDVDASTINAMIYSFGGEILMDGKPNYLSDAARSAFGVIDTLFREDLAFVNPPRTFGDQTAFGNDEIAFSFRPSSSLPYYKLVKEGNDGWGVARIPQADPAHPATVLYGANVSVFHTSPDHERTAWEFLKYFNSPAVNARWAVATGYLPTRRSATREPALQAFWNEWKYNRVGFDCLEFARGEPNIAGWQVMRGLLEKAATEVTSGMGGPDAALEKLQQAIDAEYARR